MPRRLVRAEQEPEEPEEQPEEPEPEPLLYNADVAARILGGISVSMVYRYVQTKELRPVKLGSRTLFTMEELQRFVRAKQGG
jgi:predicted DNA-binding transcriptional regulator AlpA